MSSKKQVEVTVNGDPGCWPNEDERERWKATSDFERYLRESPPGPNLERLLLECSNVPHEHIFPNQELKATCFVPFAALEELQLQSCSLRALALPPLARLEVLNISNNHIRTLRHFGALESLLTLDVSHNDLGGWGRHDTEAAAAECEALLRLPSLETINLESNEKLAIESICDGGLCTLEDLEWVSIDNTAHELGGYTQLKAGLNKLGRLGDVEIVASREVQDAARDAGLGVTPVGVGRPLSTIRTEPEPEPASSSPCINLPGEWDFMISYTQRNKDAALLAEKLHNSLRKQNRTVWLDVHMEQLNEAAMKEAAQNSGCIIAIVTGPCIGAKDMNVKSLDALDLSQMDEPKNNAYFARKYCIQELRWACEARKPIQPVIRREDKDKTTDLIGQAPEDLQHLGSTDFKTLDTIHPFWDLSVKEVLKSVRGLLAAASGGASPVTDAQRREYERVAALKQVAYQKKDLAVMKEELAKKEKEMEALQEKCKIDVQIAREQVREEQQAKEQAQAAWDREQAEIKQRSERALQQVAEVAERERARAGQQVQQAIDAAARLRDRAEAAEQQADAAAADVRLAQSEHAQAAQQMDLERTGLRQEAEAARQHAEAAKRQADEAKAAEAAAKAELEKKQQLVKVPDYWTSKTPESPTQLHPAPSMVAILDQAMNASIMARCGGCGVRNGVRVTDVQRIENMTLWRQYRCFQQSLLDRLRVNPASLEELAADAALVGSWFLSIDPGNGPRIIDARLNEFWLWHGTSHEVAGILAESGFDERVANMQGLYGAGSYFADAMCKSHQYAKRHTNAQGEHCMLYCRVVMGSPFRTTRGHQQERRPPANVADPRPGASFDSIFAQNQVGREGRQIHNEFVVFRDYQVYPEFIVRYTSK